jgi:hypothetical protein
VLLATLNASFVICVFAKRRCSSAVKMEYDFPIVVEDYDKTDNVHIWETELHDFIVLYVVPGKECVTLGICVTVVL